MLSRRTNRTTSSRRSSRPWLVGLVACTLVLAACGDGDDDSGSSGSTASGAPEDVLPITMRALGPTFTDLATVVIDAQDYWSEVGLDAEFEYLTASNAATATQGLLAGEMDVASGGTGSLYNAFAEGATQLVALGTVNPSITFGLALNTETAERLARDGVTPDSPVEERVKALKGLSLAMSPAGSTGQKYVRVMLDEYGLNPDTDITIFPSADNAAQVAATRQGRTNGFANSFPNTNLPEAEGWGVLWLNWAEDLPSILPLAGHEYYTSRSWLSENPETAKRLMEAVYLALEDLQNPSDELKEKIKNLPAFKDLNPDAFDLGWDLSVAAYEGADPVTTQEMFDNQKDLVNYGRATQVTFDLEDIYDLTAAEEAKP